VVGHAVELGFAVATHKVHGKTVEELVLDLNQYPMKPDPSFGRILIYIGVPAISVGCREYLQL
jgi:hypothetical protein